MWIIGLNVPRWREALAPTSLSPDEQQRAASFVFERDRRRFVVRRAALRAILALYCVTRAAAVRLVTDRGGKPRVERSGGTPPVRFSASHSGELALVAVSQAREVGVDVEQVRSRAGLEDLVARALAPGERRTLARAAEPGRLAAFYRCWTRKEAYLKARGLGLPARLDAVDASADVVGDRPGWRITSLDLGARYVAALAAEDVADVRVRLLDDAGLSALHAGAIMLDDPDCAALACRPKAAKGVP